MKFDKLPDNVVLIFLLIIGTASDVFPQDHLITAKDIVAGVKDSRALIQDVYVVYREIDFQEDKAGKRVFSRGEDGKGVLIAWAWKGSKEFCRVITSYDRVAGEELVVASDGETTRSWRKRPKGHGQGTIESPSYFSEPYLLRKWIFPLTEINDCSFSLDNSTIKLLTKEEVDGNLCYVLRWLGRRKTKNFFTAWVDIKRGFICLKVIIAHSNNPDDIIKEFRVLEVKEVSDGIWFPMHALERGVFSSVNLLNEYVVEEARINEGIDDSLFDIRWEPGTFIIDKIKGIKYSLPRDPRGEIEKIVPYSEIPLDGGIQSIGRDEMQAKPPYQENARKKIKNKVVVENRSKEFYQSVLWLLVGTATLLMGFYLIFRGRSRR